MTKGCVLWLPASRPGDGRTPAGEFAISRRPGYKIFESLPETLAFKG